MLKDINDWLLATIYGHALANRDADIEENE